MLLLAFVFLAWRLAHRILVREKLEDIVQHDIVGRGHLRIALEHTRLQELMDLGHSTLEA